MSDHAFPTAADGGDSQGPVFCRTTTERPVHGLLSVVIPCHNEEEVIEATHARLAEVLPATALEFEIIYIDDGSRDGTLRRLESIAARDPRVQVIELARNFGQQAAMSAGLAAARGDAIVITDADLQDPPEVILEMVRRWREGAKQHDENGTVPAGHRNGSWAVSKTEVRSAVGWRQRRLGGQLHRRLVVPRAEEQHLPCGGKGRCSPQHGILGWQRGGHLFLEAGVDDEVGAGVFGDEGRRGCRPGEFLHRAARRDASRVEDRACRRLERRDRHGGIVPLPEPGDEIPHAAGMAHGRWSDGEQEAHGAAGRRRPRGGRGDSR